MKRVTFEVAKAIKEAGYPQGGPMLYTKDGELFNWNEIEDWHDKYYSNISAPEYLDVWLWMWREKKICINCNLDKSNLLPMWWCTNEDGINYDTPNFNDPEEAIVAAINYLVEHKLLK